MTNPKEVVVKGSEKVIGYACSACHRMHGVSIYLCKYEDQLKAAERSAKACCNTNKCECGNRLKGKEKFNSKCFYCRMIKPGKQLDSIPEGYNNMFVVNDTFYSDYEDALESMELYDDGEEERIYLTKRQDFEGIRLDSILESALEEFALECGDYPDPDGVEELQEAINIFNEKNKKIHIFYATNEYITVTKGVS